jgi:hypothetical protein|uniref:Uncharacterized protein n=1 Tax=viral metagenome TaxID=1070528 RepID=A0A6C0IS39_9ZZZZ
MLSRYINIPIFLIALSIGIFAVYITVPEKRNIYVFPTHENVEIMQYKDKADNCFQYKEIEVTCPTDEKKITQVKPQY